jgi:hypothetical protein
LLQNIESSLILGALGFLDLLIFLKNVTDPNRWEWSRMLGRLGMLDRLGKVGWGWGVRVATGG